MCERLLASQGHLVAIRKSLATQMAENKVPWRLILKVEETAPFEIDFSAMSLDAAICRIRRGDIDVLQVLLADAAGMVDMGLMMAVWKGLEQLAAPQSLRGVFDWITGCPPPLAAQITIKGVSTNGMDSLAMCVADAYFARVRRE